KRMPESPQLVRGEREPEELVAEEPEPEPEPLMVAAAPRRGMFARFRLFRRKPADVPELVTEALTEPEFEAVAEAPLEPEPVVETPPDPEPVAADAPQAE